MKKGFVFLLFVPVLLTGCGNLLKPIPSDIDLTPITERGALRGLFPDFGLSNSQVQSSWSQRTIDNMTGYQVEYTQIIGSAESTVTNYLSTHETFDFMKLSRFQFGQHVTAGEFLPLNDLLDTFGANIKAEVPEASWEAVTYNGNIYAIPETAFSGMGDVALVFNMSHLAEVGWDHIPTTLGEFTELSYALQSHYGTDFNYHAFMTPSPLPDVTAISSCFDLPLNYYADSENSIHDYIFSDQAVTYYTYMNKLLRDSVLSPDWSGTTFSDVESRFINGTISVGFMPYWDMKGVYASMSALYNTKYPTVADAKAGIQWALRLRGDGTDGSSVQETAKFRTDLGIAYYIAIPSYMGKRAKYAMDFMNTKITDDNYKLLYGGELGKHYELTTADDPDAVKVEYKVRDPLTLKDTDEVHTEYRKILPAYDEEVIINSQYCTGSNIKLGAALWPIRDKEYDCWSVLVDLDDTIIRNPMTIKPVLPKFSMVELESENRVITMAQQAINTKNTTNPSKQTAGIIASCRQLLLEKYWTAEVQTEVDTWYRSTLA